MANLNVAVSITTGLYTIEIDWNDWETFVVYDGNLPPKSIPVVPNQASTYSQSTEGLLKFVLTAKTNTIVTPPQVHGYSGILLGDQKDNYQLVCNFADPTNNQNWTLTGLCNEVPKSWEPNEISPSKFSSIHMTANFMTTP